MTGTSQQRIQAECKFDISDLVACLIATEAPTRTIDQIVEIMLGGDQVRHEISTISVLGNKWLYCETPFYTRDYNAVEKLAARRGVVCELEQSGIGYSVAAIHQRTGKRSIAVASLATSAALAAISGISYGV